MFKTGKRVAESLRLRILSRLHLGLLQAGDRLPSVREIAQEFAANPRTALAAYRALAAEGIVEMRERSGIFVARRHPVAELMTPRQCDWLADIVVAGLGHGIAAPDLPAHLRRCLATRPLRAVVVECNTDQLWSMTDELSHDYGFAAEGIDLDTLDPRADALPAALTQADVVVTTAYHATAVRALAARLGVPAIVVTMCTDLFAETQRLLEREPVYYVVDDARMAAKLRSVFSQASGHERLRTLRHAHDDLSGVPATAPVYVTRLARHRLRHHALLHRTLPEARVFSRESARELAAYVIRANLGALLVEAVGGRTVDSDGDPRGAPEPREGRN